MSWTCKNSRSFVSKPLVHLLYSFYYLSSILFILYIYVYIFFFTHMRQVPLLISLRGRRLRPRVRRLTCHLLSVTSNLENISDFVFVIIVIFVIIFIIVFTVIIVIIVAPIAPESFPFTLMQIAWKPYLLSTMIFKRKSSNDHTS